MKSLRDYFITIKDRNSKFLIYTSEPFRLSELELLNLIKICIIEKRSQKIGRKLLEVYKDSNKENQEVLFDRLNKIGIKHEEKKPISKNKPKTK